MSIEERLDVLLEINDLLALVEEDVESGEEDE